MLTVEDDSFWEGVHPVHFGQLPQLQDGVTVVGYPIGGDTMSVTSGTWPSCPPTHPPPPTFLPALALALAVCLPRGSASPCPPSHASGTAGTQHLTGGAALPQAWCRASRSPRTCTAQRSCWASR
jgi:hypothetical protein